MAEFPGDRRRAQRVPYDGPVIVRHNYRHLLGDASDLSMSGISIRAPVLRLEGLRLGIAFTLPGIGRLDLEGWLVHQFQSRSGATAGIEFIEVPFMAGRLIDDYVIDQLIIPA